MLEHARRSGEVGGFEIWKMKQRRSNTLDAQERSADYPLIHIQKRLLMVNVSCSWLMTITRSLHGLFYLAAGLKPGCQDSWSQEFHSMAKTLRNIKQSIDIITEPIVENRLPHDSPPRVHTSQTRKTHIPNIAARARVLCAKKLFELVRVVVFPKMQCREHIVRDLTRLG